MATWAKGVDFKNSANSARVGGVGIYGTDGTVEKAYLGVGTEPWNKTGLEVTSSEVSFKGNKVYHAGNKPTPAEIGAAASSHTHSYVPVSAGGNITVHADSDSSTTTEYLALKAGHNILQITSSGGGSTVTKGQDKLTFNGNIVYHAGRKPTVSEIGAAAASHTHNYAATSHTHGLLHDSFGATIENTTTDNGWSMINSSYNGYLLKSLRSNANAPAWLQGNYSAGIAFGGGDTKGVMSLAYSSPSVRFAGGNGTKPVWYFTVNGSSGKTYNMDSLAANTANTLATARTINGTSFNGSANITTANWGTARNIQIGNTSKSVNGSANVSWTLSEIGAAPASHSHNYAPVENGVQRWNSVIKCATWSRIMYLSGHTTVGHSGIINIQGTRGSVVFNATFIINTSHSSKAYITQINNTNYSNFQIRAVANNNGETYVEVYDNANSATNATTQTLNVSYTAISGIGAGTLTKYTAFTDGTTIPTNFAEVHKITTVNGSHYSGNAATATKLQTARTINGTNFDGTGNITTANWGTARNISIADSNGTNTGTAVSVNGSANATLKLPSTIKASLAGNASTATTLATARTINGTSFNGSANITTANWGTARTITIGSTGKSVNGSANMSWTLSEIGALPLTGGTMTGDIKMTDGKTVRVSTTDTNARFGYEASTRDVYVSNADNSWLRLKADKTMTYAGYKVYTSYEKPTASEVGALPLSGGTMNGHITLNNSKGIYGKTAEALTNSEGSTVAAGTSGALLMYNGAHNLHLGSLVFDNNLVTGSTYINGATNIFLRNNKGYVAMQPERTSTMTFYKTYSNTNVPLRSTVATGSYLEGNKGTALLNSTATAGSYVTVAKTNSTNGYFTLNSYQQGMFLSYTAKSTVDAGTNAVTKTVKLMDESGNTSFPGTVTTNGVTTSSHIAPSTNSTLTVGTTSMPFKNVIGNNMHLYGSDTKSYGSMRTYAEGTTSAVGEARLYLGNNVASGTAGNAKGSMVIYGTNTGYTWLQPSNNTTSNITVNLPSAGGTLARTADNVASATKLQTARTISLGGILSGSASFDGSGNITISAAANDITTITKSLKVTTGWIDTGITGSNLGTGTYAVQMYVNDGTNAAQYQEYYSGIMSWFNGTTNSTDADEILLHKAGHASNGRHVYLRTLRASSSGYLKLQISCTHAFSAASSITFKFKKLI